MAPSFYEPVDHAADAPVAAYLQFLEQRNGTLDHSVAYPTREAWLGETETWTAHYGGLDADQFSRNYVRYDAATEPSLAEAMILAFVKANAGEAYGIEVISRHRLHREPRSELERLERIVGKEETYHTRIFLGATRQFGLPSPSGAWRPPLAQKLLIQTLAYVPRFVFHPILLGAELAGVFVFLWMLRRVGVVFADSPAVRETLERRLIEVLKDEVGHIAFNRLVVGSAGLAVARQLAPLVADQSTGHSGEFRALGWTDATLREFDDFDWSSLPEEVRRHSFFV